MTEVVLPPISNISKDFFFGLLNN